MQVHCAFRVLECPHHGQPMFSSEYKRSNRTRMSKILRCFPHCCPTHRPRSYCGSALHVNVSLLPIEDEQEQDQEQEEKGERTATATTTAIPPTSGGSDDELLPLWRLEDAVLSSSPENTLSEMLVYGRFEVHDPDDPYKSYLTLGQKVAAASIQANQNADIIWVGGVHTPPPRADADAEAKSQAATAGGGVHSRLFVLKEGDGESHHWEYDWRSGTSQRKRACLHQFRVYTFLADPVDDTKWQVVAMAASTPFTLSSYRKQDDDDDEGGAAGAGGTVPTEARSSAPVPGSSAFIMPPPPLSLPVGTASMSTSSTSVHGALIAHQYQPTVRATTKLAIWINFLSVLDTSWIPRDTITTRVISILRSHPELPMSSVLAIDRSSGHFATHFLQPLVVALSGASPQPRVPLASSAWFMRRRGLIELCIDVFCQLLADGTLAQLQSHIRHAVRTVDSRDEERVIASYAQFIEQLGDQVERVVRQLSDRASLDLLVDEIMSCVYEDDPKFEWVPRSTRGEVRGLLRNTSLLGLGSYREQLRQCAVVAAPSTTLHSEISGLFSGAWSCVAVDESASLSLPLPAARDFGISAISVVQLLTALHHVDVEMDADGSWLQMRCGWSLFSELWSVVLLDGQRHASAVLPNGVAPSVWQALGAGSIVGDYRGALRQVEDASIVLDLDFFVYSMDAPSYCIQTTLVPVVSVVATTGDRVDQLQMHVRVYRSRLLEDDADADGQLRREELVSQSPERRGQLVEFRGEDLVVSVTMLYQKMR